MKTIIQRVSIFFSFVCFFFVAHGQQSLEFVENRGQWKANVAFKGELSNGAFGIKKDGGYYLTMYDVAGQKALSEYIHGHFKGLRDSTANADKNKQVASAQSLVNTLLKGNQLEVTFQNANPSPEIVAEKPNGSYNNYFLGSDPSKWASGCRVFFSVTCKNIYPDIDIHYYTDAKGNLKYDLIVHNKADVSQISMRIDGIEGLVVDKGQLVIRTSVGETREAKPMSYVEKSIGEVTVPCRYMVNGNNVGFDIHTQRLGRETLVIDPQLIFSTFSGSRSSNWGFTATFDNHNNFYGGGIVFSGVYGGFQVTNGAFQTNFAGGNGLSGEGSGFDMGIIKFNPRGTKPAIYATYLGGSGNEYPQSMVVDNYDNLVIAGKTSSPDYPHNLPDYGPCNDQKNYGFDISLTKLNASGSAIIGSRRIGGSKDDGINIEGKYISAGAKSLRRNYGDDSRGEVIMDSVGNIYLSSCTQSTDFPTTSNAFQRDNGGTSPSDRGRAQDGVVIKTSPDLSTILFSTYLGGNDDDAAFVLALNPKNYDIYVAGSTASKNFPGNKPSQSFNTYQGGACDGFVSIISNDGSQLIESAYFGTSMDESIYGIQFDKVGYPYIMGTTQGNWPVTANVGFSETNGKQFVSKLEADLSGYVFSTVFGTNVSAPNISPTAFLVDRCENMYVSGWGGSTNTEEHYPSSGTLGLTVSPNAIQKRTDGSDFYFIVIKKDAAYLMYATYYGQYGGFGDHVDGGTSRFDANGVIYQAMCANCGGNGVFYTTPNAAYPTNGALSSNEGGCNLACFKIAFNLAGISSSIRSSIKSVVGKTYGCLPMTVFFIDTIGLGKTYSWDFGDGTPPLTTQNDTTSHTYYQIGDYHVRLISTDPQSCNISDTSYLTIRARVDEAPLGFKATKIIPPCDALTYRFDNLSSTPPGRSFTNKSFIINFGDGTNSYMGSGSITHTYPQNGAYHTSLTLIDTSFCNSPDSLTIPLRVAPYIIAKIDVDSISCAPYQALIKNSSIAGQVFYWDFGDSTTYKGGGEDPPPHTYSQPGYYTIRLHVVDTTTCNRSSDDSLTIHVLNSPVAGFITLPMVPKLNTPITFTNTTVGGDNYFWSFGDGDTLRTYRIDTLVSHSYNSKYYDTTIQFKPCLSAFNSFGCESDTCSVVTTLISPIFDVANAIAPNGVNNRIRVRGYGIDRIDWRIYNRWGNLLFSTTDKNASWDGTYNGKVQPIDVYTYTLDVFFTNGQKASKKGDITLIR